MANNITDIVNSIVRYLGKVSVTCNGVWKDNVAYDRLSVVYTDYASYISKKAVPAGTPVSNANYWQIISNLQDEIKIDYDTFKSEILEDIAELNKRQSSGRITVDTMDDFEKLTIVEINAGAEVYVLDTKKTYIIDEIDTQNNKEYHELVYNSLSTAAYTEVPKEERLMERIKILKDYVVEYGDKITTFPITLVQAILDLDSGKNLSSLLSMFNYLVLPWNGDFASTVNEVPDIMRNLGTLVTYKDSDGFIWTKRYKLSDFSKSNWENIDNWEGWDLQAAEEEIIEVIEKIFTNIDDYPSVKNLVVNSITTAVEDIFSSDLATYPDLYDAIKNQVNTSVNNIFANLDSYPNIKNLINTNVLNQVNYIFNHISDYPTLKTLLETCIGNIFTNIDDYPNIKTIIVDKVAEIAPGIINTIFTNIDSYPTLKNNIDLGVYSRVDYVFKHLDDYPDLKKLIQDAATADGSKYILKTDKGAANGVVPLGADSKVPAQYLPSYVDDVMEFQINTNFANTSEIVNHPSYTNKSMLTGDLTPNPYKYKIIRTNANTSTDDWTVEDLVTDKLYVSTVTNKVYRFSGNSFVEIGPAQLVLGETTGTAFDGGKGKTIQTKVNSLPATLLEANGASVEATATGANLHFQMQEFVTAEGVYTGDDKYIALLVATESSAGIMSAEDKKKLNAANKIIVISSTDDVKDMDFYPLSDQGALYPIVIKAGALNAPPGGYEYIGTAQWVYGGASPEIMLNVCVAESDMIARNEWYQAHIDNEGISSWVKLGGGGSSEEKLSTWSDEGIENAKVVNVGFGEVALPLNRVLKTTDILRIDFIVQDYNMHYLCGNTIIHVTAAHNLMMGQYEIVVDEKYINWGDGEFAKLSISNSVAQLIGKNVINVYINTNGSVPQDNYYILGIYNISGK